MGRGRPEGAGADSVFVTHQAGFFAQGRYTIGTVQSSDDPAAYRVPNQFMFGTELLVAPITEPADPGTRMGSVDAWLPEGEWIDVFTGLRYRGGRTIALHRDRLARDLFFLGRAGDRG